ncbi:MULTISPECIES: HdeD family acid-resistance protein [Sphingomonadales]|uniref:Acid-resistance membrane protein n=1 Tax=Edaphosphingomonas haloaromaticamans TaxID=653954 RepID=A0A1S1HCN2_9SPHN|nr:MULTISPECIES: HdeD family acid-resistance protein [Sphingomonas]AGH50912.1 hypothetical protein G432_15970 [Sphingomonas sp. MM-1]MDX3884820.1 HdeD family acid-resistance protein [Sphingomonas sp.]OHT19336.1 acid-resistance membrane protein [Sphingomonas haloaromaticamans]
MANTASEPGLSPPRPIGWGWILIYGIVSIAIGLFALFWPFPATLAATLTIGAFFLITGLMSIVSGISARHETRWYEILFGVISVVLGALLAFRPIIGAISLTLTVATWLGIRGALEIYWGIKIRRHRWLLIAMGVINILLDVFLLATLPFTALTLPGYILGISFLFGGFTAIMVALGYRSAIAGLR